MGTPSLAFPLLGTMDESWRQVILRASPFNFASEWTPGDWINISMGLLGVGAAAFTYRRTDKFRSKFYVAVAAVSVVALVGTALAEAPPLCLAVARPTLSPLWILKVVQVPLTFWYAAKILKEPNWYGPLGGTVLLGILGLTTNVPLEWCFPLFFLPIVALRYRGLEATPQLTDWWPRSLLTSLIFGYLSWALYKLVLLIANHAPLLRRLDPMAYGNMLLHHVGPIAWLVLFALLALWLAKNARLTFRVSCATCALVFLVQGSMAFCLGAAALRENCTRFGKDIRFVRDYLSRHEGRARPTIYSCLGRLDLVWLDLHAKSYFDWWQMGGVMFQRQMALEGQRRALVVGPFEIDRFREAGDVPEHLRMHVSRFFGLDYDTAKANLHDLKMLCQESDVDYLVLTQEFPGIGQRRQWAHLSLRLPPGPRKPSASSARRGGAKDGTPCKRHAGRDSDRFFFL